jgi:hypothetical protein
MLSEGEQWGEYETKYRKLSLGKLIGVKIIGWPSLKPTI